MNRKHSFSQLEKFNFVDICKKYKTIIESKQTDSASLRRKNLTWQRITSEYNASTHTSCQVLPKQLRRLYMNMRQRQRDALKRQRQQRITVKSEPPTSDTVDEVPRPLIAPPSPTFVLIDGANSDNLESETTSENGLRSGAEEIHELQEELFRERTREVRAKADVEKERRRGPDDLHELQKQLLKERIREARAKADLAELLLERERRSDKDDIF